MPAGFDILFPSMSSLAVEGFQEVLTWISKFLEFVMNLRVHTLLSKRLVKMTNKKNVAQELGEEQSKIEKNKNNKKKTTKNKRPSSSVSEINFST